MQTIMLTKNSSKFHTIRYISFMTITSYNSEVNAKKSNFRFNKYPLLISLINALRIKIGSIQ